MAGPSHIATISPGLAEAPDAIGGPPVPQDSMNAQDPKRQAVQQLASESLSRGDAIGWFDQLYRKAAGDSGMIPWALLRPHTHLTEWLDANPPARSGLRATVVGCGLGDDAEELARRGYQVTAFDISTAAIEWVKKRFPNSQVSYLGADLFNVPTSLKRSADLVVEFNTIQALPLEMRERTLQCIAELVAPGGKLLVVCRARGDHEDAGQIPWPVSRKELEGLSRASLREIAFEDILDEEDPPVRRFRAVYIR